MKRLNILNFEQHCFIINVMNIYCKKKREMKILYKRQQQSSINIESINVEFINNCSRQQNRCSVLGKNNLGTN